MYYIKEYTRNKILISNEDDTRDGVLELYENGFTLEQIESILLKFNGDDPILYLIDYQKKLFGELIPKNSLDLVGYLKKIPDNLGFKNKFYKDLKNKGAININEYFGMKNLKGIDYLNKLYDIVYSLNISRLKEDDYNYEKPYLYIGKNKEESVTLEINNETDEFIMLYKILVELNNGKDLEVYDKYETFSLYDFLLNLIAVNRSRNQNSNHENFLYFTEVTKNQNSARLNVIPFVTYDHQDYINNKCKFVTLEYFFRYYTDRLYFVNAKHFELK